MLNMDWIEILGGMVCTALFVFFIAGGAYFVLRRGKADGEGRGS
jgi:hypothetical protein